MGVVYLATEPRPRRRIALKLIAPALAADPPTGSGSSARSTPSPPSSTRNVVPIHAAGEWEGQLYLAMRYPRRPGPGRGRADARPAGARGGPRSPRPDRRRARHGPRPGHRPPRRHAGSNIRLDARGIAVPDRLRPHEAGGDRRPDRADPRADGDAGLHGARAVRGDGAAAPAPDPALAPRADVYALGCVLVTLLTGSPPYPRDTYEAALWAHVHADPPRDHRARPGLPARPSMRWSRGPSPRTRPRASRRPAPSSPPRGRRSPTSPAGSALPAASAASRHGRRGPRRAAPSPRRRRRRAPPGGRGAAIAGTAGAPGVARSPLPCCVVRSARCCCSSHTGSGIGRRAPPRGDRRAGPLGRPRARQPSRRSAAPDSPGPTPTPTRRRHRRRRSPTPSPTPSPRRRAVGDPRTSPGFAPGFRARCATTARLGRGARTRELAALVCSADGHEGGALHPLGRRGRHARTAGDRFVAARGDDGRRPLRGGRGGRRTLG